MNKLIISSHKCKLRSKRGEQAKVMFLARDALGTYQAAQTLLEKFPDRYPGVETEQLVYAYLTRKVVANTDEETLSQYIKELGIKSTDQVILADIGMFGTLIDDLRNKLPELPMARIDFLIARTFAAEGFLDDDESKRMDAFAEIIDNPAVHFLEDTFSGLMQSPTRLVETPAGIQPDTTDSTYPADIALKRKYALMAITDYVQELDEVKPYPERSSLKLDLFLQNPDNFTQLQVPHERH